MLELPLPRENRNEQQLLSFVTSEMDHAIHSVPNRAISLASKKGAKIPGREFIRFLASCIKYLTHMSGTKALLQYSSTINSDKIIKHVIT